MVLPFSATGSDKKGSGGDDFEAKLDRLREIARDFMSDLEDLKRIAHDIKSATEEMGDAKSSAIVSIKQAKKTAIEEINEAANRARSNQRQGYSSSNQHLE